MYLPFFNQLSSREARTNRYRTVISDMQAKGICNYLAIFKALLQDYVNYNKTIFFVNHADFCMDLITEINGEGYGLALMADGVKLEKRKLYFKKVGNTFEYTIIDTSNKAQNGIICASDLDDDIVDDELRASFINGNLSVEQLRNFWPLIVDVTRRRGHAKLLKIGIGEFIQKITEYIASRKQLKQYDESCDFQIMIDIFLTELEKPLIISGTTLQQKYIKFAQNFRSYEHWEVLKALEYLAEINQEFHLKCLMVERLVVPILCEPLIPGLQEDVMGFILPKFLPLADNLTEQLVQIMLLKLKGLPANYEMNWTFYACLAKLSPTHVDVQQTLISYCPTGHKTNVKILIGLLPYIKVDNLKNAAIHILVKSLNYSEECDQDLINALVNLLTNVDDKNMAIVILKDILNLKNVDAVYRFFFTKPLTIKLGCAYLRAQGQNEEEIQKALLSRPGISGWSMNDAEVDCVLAVLTGFKNFDHPAYRIGFQNFHDSASRTKSELEYLEREISSANNSEHYLVLLQEYPDFVAIYKQELIDIIKTIAISMLKEQKKNTNIAIKTLRQLAKSDVRLQQAISDQILALPDPVLISCLGKPGIYRADEFLPAEYTLTNTNNLNRIFDLLLPFLAADEDFYQQVYIFQNINYYIEKLSSEQLQQVLTKIKTKYPEENLRSDFCQILLANIERKLVIEFVNSAESYPGLIPAAPRNLFTRYL